MGICFARQSAKVQDPKEIAFGTRLQECVERAFEKLDVDFSRRIDREEASKAFKGFTKLNVEAMFEEMDENNDGQISHYEWEFYFKRVLASGFYTEDEVADEIELFLDGEGFCRFEAAPATGARRPSMNPGDMKIVN